ncbi:MAG: flagellar hook protein [Desulfovibrio sp.]|nr:flagellar hook protein [Desulfovibrio sp.]
MSLRVTQNSMYRTMTGQMQKSLSAYMESNEQGSSQKKINRPSDDPAGTYRVLMTRDDINATKQYQSNVDTAKGWLTLADNVLGTQVSTVLTSLKSLAEQASTGTYTAENRSQIASQVREIFGQFLNLANTEFEGKSIFAGHRYNLNAYEEGLGLCSWDENWSDALAGGEYTVQGASASTMAIQFTESGTMGDGTTLDEDGNPTKTSLTYRWSDDGGESWHEGLATRRAVDADGNVSNTLDLGNGVVVTLNRDLKAEAADVNAGPGARNGTLVYIRPQAFYQGDDNDAPPKITLMGTGSIEEEKVFAAGTFGSNVLLRMDAPPANATTAAYDPGSGSYDLTTTGETLYYSYSTDSGSTWITATAVTSGDGKLHMPVPSGYVDVDATDNSSAIGVGAQILVRPHRADLNLEIMKDTYIPINNVGKDIFGGEYDGKPVLPEDEDLFGMVGDFIAYLENNNQEGCQRTLARIASVQEHILTECARIGGLENRVSTAADVLSFQKVDQEERLSYIEDIDLTELLNKLTRQQLTYQTVLQSSSKIMQMSLADYI